MVVRSKVHCCFFPNQWTWRLVGQLAADGRTAAVAENFELLDSEIEKDRQVPNHA